MCVGRHCSPFYARPLFTSLGSKTPLFSLRRKFIEKKAEIDKIELRARGAPYSTSFHPTEFYLVKGRFENEIRTKFGLSLLELREKRNEYDVS